MLDDRIIYRDTKFKSMHNIKSIEVAGTLKKKHITTKEVSNIFVINHRIWITLYLNTA